MKWKKGKPKESGQYVCLNESGWITTLDYSAKHESFNCDDNYTKNQAKKLCMKGIKKWVKYEDLIKEIEDE